MERLESKRMGELPEGKLLLEMAVPMILSMLVQALYNIVDSIYVARVSENCLTALSLAFPAQNVIIGLATGTGVGVTALVSRALGSGQSRRAAKVSGNALTLCVVCAFLIGLFGVFGVDAFIQSQTDDLEIIAYGDSYLKIIATCSIFMYFSICLERLLQSTGLTKLSMWTQMSGAVTNIVLDPFFIYGWCGLPAMGTAGAAVATIIGQAVSCAVGFCFHLRFNREIANVRADFKPDLQIIREIYAIGFPSILMVGIGSFTNYFMNIILIGFTSTAVAVFSAYFKVQSFFFMPVFGINSSIIPIVAYNYGAQKKERIYRTIKYGVGFASCFMLAGFLLFEFCPQLLLGMFSPSEEMLKLGCRAYREICVHFPLAGFCIVSGSICQALGKSLYSFFVSLLRQVVVLIPAAYLLSLTGDVNMVWWCFPIAELMSFAASAFFLRSALKVLDQPVKAA